MAEQIPYKFYTFNVNGAPEVQAVPGTNTPYGQTETNDPLGVLKSQADYWTNYYQQAVDKYGMADINANMPALKGAIADWANKQTKINDIYSRKGALTSDDIAYLQQAYPGTFGPLDTTQIATVLSGGSVGSGYYDVNGVPMTESAMNTTPEQAAYNAQLKAAMQSGTQPAQLAPGVDNPYAGANAAQLNTATPNVTYTVPAAQTTPTTGTESSSRYVRQTGTNNVYDTQTGKYVTYAEAQAIPNFFANVKEVNYALPNISEAGFSSQNLTDYEKQQLVSGVTPEQVTSSDDILNGNLGNDLLNDLLAQITNGSASSALDIANAGLDAARQQLSDLANMEEDEIRKIVGNPEISARWKRMKISYLEEPGSAYWTMYRIAQSDVANAEASKANILEALSLQSQDMDRAIQLYNIMKPNIVDTFTDNKTGKIMATFYDPIAQKVYSVDTGVMGEKSSQYTAPSYFGSAETGYYVSVMDKETGKITTQKITNPVSGGGGSLTTAQKLAVFNTIQDNARQNPAISQYAGNYATFQAALNAPENSGGDIILMRALAKVSDPTSSVREEEFRTFEGAQGQLQQYYNLPKEWLGKGKLTDTGRAAIQGLLQQQFDVRQQEYESAYNYYMTQIQNAGGTAADFAPHVGDSQQNNNTTVTEADVLETVKAHYKEYTPATREQLIQKLIAAGADKDVAARYVYQYLP